MNIERIFKGTHDFKTLIVQQLEKKIAKTSHVGMENSWRAFHLIAITFQMGD
jgi:hypothetical protein